VSSFTALPRRCSRGEQPPQQAFFLKEFTVMVHLTESGTEFLRTY
jgi:hypothetical protein